MKEPYRTGEQTLPEPPSGMRRHIIELSATEQPGHLRLVPRRRPRQALFLLSVFIVTLGFCVVFSPSLAGAIVAAAIGCVCVLVMLFLLLRVEDIWIEGNELVKKNHVWGIGPPAVRVLWRAIEAIEINRETLNEVDDICPHLLLRLFRRSPRRIAEFLWFEQDELLWVRNYLMTAIARAHARADAGE